MIISEIQSKITPVLKAYGVKKASLFGSIARGEDHPDSDIDLLVELGPRPMGLFEYIGLKHKLEDILGKKVDLVSEGYVIKYFEPYIKKDLKKIYEG